LENPKETKKNTPSFCHTRT
jgi:hypothetical protein